MAAELEADLRERGLDRSSQEVDRRFAFSVRDHECSAWLAGRVESRHGLVQIRANPPHQPSRIHHLL